MDDILVPFRQVERIHTDLLEVMPEEIVDALALAWHHDHLFYQSRGKKKHDHRRESDYWLNFSKGLLDDRLGAALLKRRNPIFLILDSKILKKQALRIAR
jgi:hypothetical protein